MYVPDGKGAQLQAQGIWCGEGDDQERFLADLRALRDAAALGYDELAVRTHYPDDILKEAESGPSLPGLPVLAAYVRACDGDVPEWEERWRRLGFDSRADPGLPVRPPGASPAAAAGARVSVEVAPPDAYDPERIRAVLRGIHHSDRTRGTASRGSAVPGRVDAGAPGPAMAPPRTQEFRPGWNAGTSQNDGWSETTGPSLPDIAEGTSHPQPSGGTGLQPDERPRFHDDVADPGGAPANGNGNHHRSQPSGASGPGTQDEARADAIRRDPFSTDWLQDSEPTAGDGTESGWQDHADTGPSPAAADSWFTPPEREDTGLAPQFALLEQGDTELAASPSAESSAAGPLAAGSLAAGSPATGSLAADALGAGTLAAESPAAGTPAAGTLAADTLAAGTLDTADRTAPVPVADVSVAPARTAAGSAVPPRQATPTREQPSDRLFLVRLLVVIVVAALIGSVLVLLLR